MSNFKEVVDRIIDPAVEEVLKAVMAKYTAEEIITKRGEVKAGVDDFLTLRLAAYHIAVDDVSLVSAFTCRCLLVVPWRIWW
jgi:prohibitin 1